MPTLFDTEYTTMTVTNQLPENELPKLARQIDAYFVGCNVRRIVREYVPEAQGIRVISRDTQRTYEVIDVDFLDVDFLDVDGKEIPLTVEHWKNADWSRANDDVEIIEVDAENDHIVIKHRRQETLSLTKFLEHWIKDTDLYMELEEVVNERVKTWDFTKLVAPVVYVP